jgi:hypothetical protein
MEPSGIIVTRDRDVGLEPLDATPSHQLSRPQSNYIPHHPSKYGNDAGENRAESLPLHISPMPRYSVRPSNRNNNHNANPEATSSSSVAQQSCGGKKFTSSLQTTRTALMRRSHSPHTAPPSVTETSISNKSRVSSLLARFEVTAKEILEQEKGHSTVPTTIDINPSEPDILLSRNKNHELVQRKIVLYNNHKHLEMVQDANDSRNAITAKESMIRSLLLCGAVPLPHLRGGDRGLESRKDKIQHMTSISKPTEEVTLVRNTSRSIMGISLCGGGIDDAISSEETTNAIQNDNGSPTRNITRINSTPVEVVRLDPVATGRPIRQCTPTLTRHFETPRDMTICTASIKSQDMMSPMSDETRRRRRGEARDVTPVFSQKYISMTTSATADDSFISESFVEDEDCHSISSCSDQSAAATGGTSQRRKVILSSKSKGDDDNAPIVNKSVPFSSTVDSMGREYDVFADPSADAVNDDDCDDSREVDSSAPGVLSNVEKVNNVAPDRYASPGDHIFLEMGDKDHNYGQEVLLAGTENQLSLENPDAWASPSNPRSVAYRPEPGHRPRTSLLTTAVLPLDESLSNKMDSEWDVPKPTSLGDVQTNILAQRSIDAEQELRSMGSNPTAPERSVSNVRISDEQPEIGICQTFPPFAHGTNIKSSRDVRPISPESNHRRSRRPLQQPAEETVVSTNEADHVVGKKEVMNLVTCKKSTSRSADKKKELLADQPQDDGTQVATSKKSKSRRSENKGASTALQTLEDAMKTSSNESWSWNPHKQRESTRDSEEGISSVHDTHGVIGRRTSSNSHDKPHSSRCETPATVKFSEERNEHGLERLLPAKSSREELTFHVRKDVALRPQLQSVLNEIQRRRAERQLARMPDGDEEQGTKAQRAEGLAAVDVFTSTEAKCEELYVSPVLGDSGPIIAETNRTCNPKKSTVLKAAFDEYDRLLDQLLRQNKNLKQGESASQTSLGDDSGVVRDRIAWIRRERDQAIDLYDFSIFDALKTRKYRTPDRRDDKASSSLNECRDLERLQPDSLIASNIGCIPKIPVQMHSRDMADSTLGKGEASRLVSNMEKAGSHLLKSNTRAHEPSLVEQNGNRSEILSPMKSCRHGRDSHPKSKMDTKGVFQARFQTPADKDSRTIDDLAAPSSTKTCPARLPFLARLEETLDRPPRVVCIEVREPRNAAPAPPASKQDVDARWDDIWESEKPTTTNDCVEDARLSCSPQQRRQRRPATTTTTAAKPPMVPSPERKRGSGPTATAVSSCENTRKLRRQLDLARLTNLAIRNSNQSLSLELEAFKRKLWQHRNCTRGERNILEACQYQLGSFQRHLEEKRKLPKYHDQHSFWSQKKSNAYYQGSNTSSEECIWDEFSNIQGAMLANLELMQSARASIAFKVRGTRYGGDEKGLDEDTARLREVIAMMKSA